MSKNRNFNNNIYNKNTDENTGINILDDDIDKKYPIIEDEIDIEKVIPQKLNIDIDKIVNNDKEIKKEFIRPIFKPLPQNKIYFSNPDINLIITCYVKHGKDLNIFKIECAKLGYIDLLFKENDKTISFMWNGKRFEYEKCNL
jgi:hypothetical protein